MEEISAGGVVIENNLILTLKKYQGDWVLPKGRVEEGETLEQTALREVYEETGTRCEAIKYIGYLKYNYRHSNGKKIQKTVHYYLMKVANKEDMKPQREEGFMDVNFLRPRFALAHLRHEAEKNMVKRALEIAQIEY